MVWGIGFGIDRIGRVAIDFPRSAAICMAALVALIGISLPKLSFDDDIHRVFLSDSPLSQAQRSYEAAQTPPLSTILILIASPAPMNAADMTTLRDLSLDLEFVPGVTAVASPFVLRRPPTADAPSGTPLFAPQIATDFASDLSEFKVLGTGLPTFMNDANTAMILSVSVDTSQTPVSDARSAITAELSRALPANLTGTVTGEDVISAEIVAGLKGDLIALNLWGGLIVALAALVFLRDLRMTILAVVPAVFGAAGVLALSVWLGYPITVLSNVIPILLLVLGVADGVHLAAHVKDHGSSRLAVVSVGPACALTAMTTAVAFASIMLTGNAQLFEFAVLGVLGTMLSFAIVITMFALLGRMMTLSPRPIPRFSNVIAARLIAIGSARPRLTVVLCVAVLGLSAFGFMRTKAWFPLYQNLPGISTMGATNDAISDNFGGVFQMIVETDGDWATTRKVAETLEAASEPRTVLSEVNFARWLGHPDTRPTAAEYDTLPQALVAQLQPDANVSRIFVSMPEPMRNDATLVQFDALHDAAIDAGAARIFGLPTVMRFEAVGLIDQLSWGLTLSALGATLLVALAFRSVRLVPLLIIPNILPLMLTGASLHLWAQGQLNPTAVLALTIAFGIAIDDTVHFLSRYIDARSQGGGVRGAIAQATKSAGQVMVLTTLLLIAGLSVTMFSDFAPIRLFGGMMMTTLLAALLIDLLLLPALLLFTGGRNDAA